MIPKGDTDIPEIGGKTKPSCWKHETVKKMQNSVCDRVCGANMKTRWCVVVGVAVASGRNLEWGVSSSNWFCTNQVHILPRNILHNATTQNGKLDHTPIHSHTYYGG